MDKVRFVVIGVGGMARAHIRAIGQCRDAEVAALVDPSSKALDVAREMFPDLCDVPSFADYREALSAVPADAALIVSPHSQHFEQGMTCIDHGLHVLMEKPFVAGSANAERIIAHARDAGVVLAVAYQRHLQGPYLYMRQLVQSGELGKLTAISAYQAQAWQQATAGTWRQDPALSCGGQLNDSGSHLLDVVLWISGLQPEEVTAHIDNRGTRVDIDSFLTVRLQDGVMATFNILGSATIPWWEDVSVHGDKGAALFRNGKLLVTRGIGMPSEVPAEDLPPSTTPVADFVDVLLGRKERPAAPAECGLAVARLTEAAWRSAERGCAISLHGDDSADETAAR